MRSILSTLILTIIALLIIMPASASAASSALIEGTITRIVDEQHHQTDQGEQITQTMEILLTTGEKKGETVNVEQGSTPSVHPKIYVAGDKVLLDVGQGVDDQPIYQISDYIRRWPLLILTIMFVALTLLVNRRKGVFALLSMIATFAALFFIIFPMILRGYDSVLVALLASLIIIPLSYYVAHGLNRKTTIAVVSTLICLVFSVVLASVFINLTKLSGYSTDEAGFLAFMTGGQTVDIRGLVLAGIVLGLSGVLDDITIAQAAIVQQLKAAQPHIAVKELYNRAMSVGRDHISSLVNTLILVYAGASMPLLLLFLVTQRPFMELINYEIIAEEIVRTLVVSMGIILSVPLTTYIAAKTINIPTPDWVPAFLRRPDHGLTHDHHH